MAVSGEADPAGDAHALEGKKLPVYGDGSNLRDWIFVEDHAAALVRVLERGEPGATYAIGARQPRSNLEVVRAICAHLDRRVPDPAGPRERLIHFVTDRGVTPPFAQNSTLSGKGP